MQFSQLFSGLKALENETVGDARQGRRLVATLGVEFDARLVDFQVHFISNRIHIGQETGAQGSHDRLCRGKAGFAAGQQKRKPKTVSSR